MNIVLYISSIVCISLYTSLSVIPSYAFKLNASNLQLQWDLIILLNKLKYNWRPPSLSKLTPYRISLGLTHLASEAFIFIKTRLAKANLEM